MHRIVLLFLLFSSSCAGPLDFPYDDDDNYTEDYTSAYNDSWSNAYNLTSWWEDDHQQHSNLTIEYFTGEIKRQQQPLTLIEQILGFFKAHTTTTDTPHTLADDITNLFSDMNKTGNFLYVTYVELLPMIECDEIKKVVELFNTRIGQENPTAWLESRADELEGHACNATHCECPASTRQKLSSKTLRIQTHSTSDSLRPVHRFPLRYETIAAIQ